MGLLDALRRAPVMRLRTDNGETAQCTAADVEDALREVIRNRETAFLTLEPETPLKEVRFLQAAGFPGGFQVEMSVRAGGCWQMYGRTVTNVQELQRLFLDFLRGRVPPLDGFSPFP